MEYEAQCVICGDRFLSGKPNAATCCSAHRQQLHRNRRKAEEEALEAARRQVVAEQVMRGGFRVIVEPAPPDLLEAIRR